jgi:geranylgeranyl pyrophosphate synthase
MDSSHHPNPNQTLFKNCLTEIERQVDTPDVLELLQKALSKSLKPQSTQIVPPLYASLTAEDLGAQDQAWLPGLTMACAFLYTAADLFDDIQDHETHQPVIQASNPEQAINIANLLLMACHKVLLGLPLSAELRLQLLELFTHSCQVMSIGQFLDIRSTNRNALDILPESIFPKKAGAEFACFVLAGAMPLTADPASRSNYAALGQEMGSLLQIFTDFFDIWVPQSGRPHSQDLAIYKNSFPIFWARADHHWQEPVEEWLAGSTTQASRQFQLRRLLVHTQALEKFSDYLTQARLRVSDLAQNLPALPQIQAIWQTHCQNSATLLDSLFELRKKTPATAQPVLSALRLSSVMAQALDYLNFIEGYQDVWEVQRWGFLNEPVLIGNLFNPLLVLESLMDAGQDIKPELENILKRRLEDGWHYYSQSLKIPPDSDDLGQILQLVARNVLPDLEPLLGTPLQVLESNLEPNGFCPTWLCDEIHHTRAEVSKAWFGNACPGVMANLYYGLAHYDQTRYSAQIDQGIRYLIEQFDADKAQWPDVYYLSPLYVAYLISRLMAYQGVFHPCLEAVQARVLSEQSLDGSWFQAPQSTAFALLFLLSLPAEQRSLSLQAQKKALIYLVDTQDYDGSWPGEDFFIRPGREGAFEAFSHPKLCTAFVLRALAKGQAEFGFEREPA